MLNLFVSTDSQEIRTTNNHYFMMIDELINCYSFQKIKISDIQKKSAEEMREFFQERFQKIPSNLIFFENLTEMYTFDFPTEIKINVIMVDLHHGGKIKTNRIKSLKKVSRVLASYGYCFHKYYDTKTPVYYFPHCVAFDTPFNATPINKVLVTGRLNKTIYPFRDYAWYQSKKNKNIHYLPVNCNYKISSHNDNLIYGKKYIENLGQYLACFTCDASETRPYVVAKHFEIMSSGSLLLAGNVNTKNYFDQLGFRDGYHYLSVTPANFLEKVNYITNPENLTKINEIRLNGYQYCRSHHHIKNRIEYLQKIFNNEDIELHTNGINQSKYFF